MDLVFLEEVEGLLWSVSDGFTVVNLVFGVNARELRLRFTACCFWSLILTEAWGGDGDGEKGSVVSPELLGEVLLIPTEDRGVTNASLPGACDSEDERRSILSPTSIGEVELTPVRRRGVSFTTFSREILVINMA